jgi:membrane protease YdiL (CAAX protease family)
MFTTLIAALFAAMLVIGVPALSYSTTRNSQIRELPRLSLYVSAVFSQWVLTVLGLGVVFLVAREVFRVGFRAVPLVDALCWATGIALASLLALGLVLLCERRGWLPQESELVNLLIPETTREKVWAVAIVAPTAAFCEEFLFRGFLLTQLNRWFHSVGWAWVVCSVAFGLAHSYQGWSGMIRAGLLGALLAYPVVRFGSLYPSMLAHGLIDAVALVWLGRWLIPKYVSVEGRMLE